MRGTRPQLATMHLMNEMPACSANMQGQLTTTDHVLVETWAIARSRRNRTAADALLETILRWNLSEVLTPKPDDIPIALALGDLFSDQDFSMVNRISWIVMVRYGLEEAISFDADFAAYRYGSGLQKAFIVHR